VTHAARPGAKRARQSAADREDRRGAFIRLTDEDRRVRQMGHAHMRAFIRRVLSNKDERDL